MRQESSLFVWLHLFDHAFLGVLLPVDLTLLTFFCVGFGPGLSERCQVVDLFTLEALLIQLHPSHVQRALILHIVYMLKFGSKVSCAVVRNP